MRLIRREGYVWRRVAGLVALALAMFILSGDRLDADHHQFLLCSGPGETIRADGTDAVAGDYIIVVNSRNFEAITNANDQVPEETITEDDVQSSGGSFVRDDLSWGMYIPSGYVYQEAGSTTCVINLKLMMREKGQDYFKEAVVDFDDTAPCQGRLWLNTTRDPNEDAAVCPRGAPASTSGANPGDNTGDNNNDGDNSGGSTNTVVPPGTVEEPEDGNTGGGTPGGNTGGGNTGGGTTGGNTGGGNTGGGTTGGNTGGGTTGGNTGGTSGGNNSGTPGGNNSGGDSDDGNTDGNSDGETSGDASDDSDSGSTSGDSGGQTSDDDLLTESRDDDQSQDDLMELVEEDSDAGDMLEADSEAGDGDVGLRPQETVRPDAPKTGTGGVAANRDSSGRTIPIAAAASLAAALAAAVLIVNRRLGSNTR